MRGKTSSTKVTSFFTASGSKSDDAVLVAEGAFVFHTVKHHCSYKTAECTYVLFKQYFLILKYPANFQVCRQRQNKSLTLIPAHAVANIMQVFKNNCLTVELPQMQANTML
jgi:hypothetical protein